MFPIWRVIEREQVEGRGVHRVVYFSRRITAETFHQQLPQFREKPVQHFVAESVDELTKINIQEIQERALAKLTEEERAALGVQAADIKLPEYGTRA